MLRHPVVWAILGLTLEGPRKPEQNRCYYEARPPELDPRLRDMHNP